MADQNITTRQDFSCKGNRAEYNSWSNMRQRCTNPKTQKYKYYGGRGITVCARWASFAHFLTDMGRKPTPKHSIDRINNDGNYEPSNCRWATHDQQMENTRSDRNHVITLNGQSLTITEWAATLGIERSVMYRRLKRWPLERALTEPLFPKIKTRPITFEGETMRLKDWAFRIGITSSVLHRRLRNWPLERALTKPPHRK